MFANPIEFSTPAGTGFNGALYKAFHPSDGLRRMVHHVASGSDFHAWRTVVEAGNTRRRLAVRLKFGLGLGVGADR